jgi:hypothetical protein
MNHDFQAAAKRESERETAYKEWLMSLKEGDEVAIPSRGSYDRVPTITCILKVTTTQLVMKEHALEVRYNRHDGTARGRSFTKLQPVTDEVRAKIKHAGNVSWLTGLTIRSENLYRIPPAVLDAMRAAYVNAIAQHDTAPQREEQ